MRKNAILKHAIAAALVGSGGLFATSAWGGTCGSYGTSNWNSTNWGGVCSGSVPSSSDSVYIMGTVSLGGANAQASMLAMSGGALNDNGGGSLTVAGSFYIYGTLSFTSAPITFTAANTNVSTSSTLSLQGTATNPIRLSTSGTVNFMAVGTNYTYTLSYVHFASGTWTQDSSVTSFPISHCTYATGVSVPATWGCTLPPPTAPTGLTATAASQTQIDLAWTDNSSDETGFKIFRDGVELTPSPKVGANATATATYSDTGLTCGTTYTYEVKATNANGDSTGIPASATTAACPPASTSTGTPAILLDPTYTLTIKTSGKGTGMIGYQTADITGKAVGSLTECGKPEGCTYTLPTTSWIKLIAVPTGDSLFSGFAGNIGQCSNGLIFLTQNTECTAYFNQKPVPVTTSPVVTPPTDTTTPPTDTTTPPTGTTTPPPGTTTPPTDTTTPPTGTTTPPTDTTTPPTGTTTPPTGTTTPPTGTTTPPTGTTTPPTGTTTPPTGTTTPPTETTTPPVVVPITPTPEGASSSSSNSSDGQCLPKDNTLNWPCNANWAILKDFQIQAKGHLSSANITGKLTIHNTGWAANIKLKGKGNIKGGILTGYITCENDNVITDMTEFKGAVLKGCTLEGSILNTSRLEGKGLIRDVKLGTNAKVKGGRVGGKIEGDAKSPATLDWLEIDQGSELSNVILGKHVSMAPGVKLDDSVELESSIDK